MIDAYAGAAPTALMWQVEGGQRSHETNLDVLQL